MRTSRRAGPAWAHASGPLTVLPPPSAGGRMASMWCARPVAVGACHEAAALRRFVYDSNEEYDSLMLIKDWLPGPSGGTQAGPDAAEPWLAKRLDAATTALPATHESSPPPACAPCWFATSRRCHSPRTACPAATTVTTSCSAAASPTTRSRYWRLPPRSWSGSGPQFDGWWRRALRRAGAADARGGTEGGGRAGPLPLRYDLPFAAMKA